MRPDLCEANIRMTLTVESSFTEYCHEVGFRKRKRRGHDDVDLVIWRRNGRIRSAILAILLLERA